MSKRNLVISIAILVAALLAIALILIINEGKKTRIQKIYNKMKNSSEYTFSMEESTTEFDYKVSMLQNGNDICIDMYSDEEHTTTLILENKSYYIMHNEKEYYDYGDEKIDSDVVLSSLRKFVKKTYTKGKEKINEMMYYYEEYENDETDFIIFANINESSNIKTRFYFNGNNICYIKNIIVSDDGRQEELIKVDLKYSIDNNLFSIPEEYAEVADF